MGGKRKCQELSEFGQGTMDRRQWAIRSLREGCQEPSHRFGFSDIA